jgi:hypothetical protein
MLKRLTSVGIAALLSSQAGAALAAPAYCPTSSPSVCAGRSAGDILITLHSSGSPGILRLDPITGVVSLFTTALEQFAGSTELGDIAVLPNDPTRVVVIGNLNSGIGIRQLDSCGNLTPAVYGPFPSQLPAPFAHVSKGSMVNRGLVFSPQGGYLYSPGIITTPFASTTLYSVFAMFQPGGVSPPATSSFSYVLATGAPNLIDATSIGAVAADEHGSLYVGESGGTRIALIPAAGLQQNQPKEVEYVLTGDQVRGIQDMVHDGDHHLFVTGSAWNWDFTQNQGFIWRVDTLSGVVQTWAINRGPAYGYEPWNAFQGITIDGAGNILAVEKASITGANNRVGVARISARDGSLLAYYPIPSLVEGRPAATASPFTLAVLGVPLPAVREACASGCAPGMISDCNGACATNYLGDAFCDSNFACWARGDDLGTCNGCPADQVLDCNGICGPKDWVGDSICDNGGGVSYFAGQYISYDCEEFRFDETTCRASCGSSEKLDCNGNCSPAWWYGDGVCDDGAYTYYGRPVDYGCVEYDFDRNVCF